MKLGRKPTARAPISAALAACTDPLGATHGWLIEQTGADAGCLKATVHRMVAAGEIFAIKRFKDSRYFLSADQRDAAAPAVLGFFAALDQQRRQRQLESQRRRDKARAKARYTPRAKMAPEIAEAARAAERDRRQAKRPQKPPKPPKPPKTAAPKPATPKVAKPPAPKPAAKRANVTITVNRTRAWWDASAEPVITSKTKVTIAPPPPYAYRTNTHSR
jgi:HAMP domain-containing protein